jgi:hypothetical protein
MSRFSESDRDFDATKLSPEQRRTYDAAAKAANMKIGDTELGRQILKTEIRAKYKIEVMFGPNRTSNGPNAVCIQAFESGKRFHGGGDDLMYWCKDVNSDSGCWSPITGDRIAGGVAFCFNCGRLNAERLTCQRFMNVTTQTLADHVAKIWRQLESSADIYCKYNKDDFRYIAIEKKRGSEEARRLRGLFIYPLKNILKDTAAGASVEGRFASFFKA